MVLKRGGKEEEGIKAGALSKGGGKAVTQFQANAHRTCCWLDWLRLRNQRIQTCFQGFLHLLLVKWRVHDYYVEMNNFLMWQRRLVVNFFTIFFMFEGHFFHV